MQAKTYQLKSFFSYLQETYNCMCNTTQSQETQQFILK